MKRLILLCQAVIGCIITVNAQSNWKTNYYERYSYRNYTNYESFNHEVEVTTFDARLLNAAIFYETNRQRSLYGMAEFKYHQNLEVCAQSHSEDMANWDFFSHESPVSGKRTMTDRMRQVGFVNLWMAENISYHDVSNRTYSDLAKSIVDSWMNSPGHRANIL
ncbi:MAG: hypothetical protein KA298_06115, partial [Paludibacteraceae bacterium]|nr:hypothetical protein [Paludibacteraceae bacterium]